MVEEAAFTVREQFGELEIRHYPKLLLATVTDLSDTEAFWVLFRYISGHNQAKQKIDMTAPVITSQKIAMTVPVITLLHRLSFVMPAHFTLATLPVPLDPRVQLGEQAEKTVAVLRFKGHAAHHEVARNMNELLALLQQHHKKTAGEPFLLCYNAPYVPGFLRRNEVGIELEE